MIQSMTGYGKALLELPSKRISIELKSLNSKQLDINVRMPALYREKELEMRNEAGRLLERGKIDINVNCDALIPEKTTTLNEPVISGFYTQLQQIASNLNIPGQTDFLRIIMTLPDTLRTEQPELNEEEWQHIRGALNNAIEQLLSFRKQEGSALYKDMLSRIEKIAQLLREIEPLEKQRTQKIKQRIHNNLEELSPQPAIDENRYEQEMIYYMEKLDISEEKVRLENHLQYFTQTLQEEGSVGKKLAFITQEMGREINTLGSKANDSEIQHLVIKMKDELEKIKEQVLNIL